MDIRDTPLKVAVLDARPEYREELRYFLHRNRCESVIFLDSKQQVANAFNDGKCNSLIVNIGFLGSKDSLELISTTRQQHTEVPICVVDNFAAVLGQDHADWKKRLMHYYSLPYEADRDLLGECVEITTRLFRFYLHSRASDYQLRDMRHYLSSEEAQLSLKTRNLVLGLFLNVAEELVRSEQRLSELQTSDRTTQQVELMPKHNGTVMAKEQQPLEAPNTVTLHWLYQHVPYSLWSMLISALVAAFLAGITATRLPILQDWFTVHPSQGNEAKPTVQPAATPPVKLGVK